jgi:hypothetical protein
MRSSCRPSLHLFDAGRAASRVVGVLCVLLALAVSLSGAASALAASTVVTWGENDDGQLGNGSFPGPESCPEGGGYCSRTPVPVSGLSGVQDLAGGSQGLALLNNGTVMAWGRNADGQLGNDSRENSDVPVLVPGLSGRRRLIRDQHGAAEQRHSHGLGRKR